MRRQRLRPAYSDVELTRVYPRPHDHSQWVDHQMRVAATVLVARSIDRGATSGADLSCGDGAILRSLNLRERHYGDFAAGWQYQGPMEKTLGEIPDVHLFVCTETVEHLDDPDDVLNRIRERAQRLVLSTPVEAWDDTNPEHYWAWDREAVEAMLAAAGWRVAVYAALDFRPSQGDYMFGIWSCL